MTNRISIQLVAGALCLAALTGCMQIDTHVKLNEDGGATITEKVRFSRKLLELSGPVGSDTDIAGLLTKETAQARAKSLGKGCALVSYDVAEIEGAAKQAVAVYKIEDIAELRYVSPYLAYADYEKNHTVKFVLDPKMKSGWEGWSAGEIALRIELLKPGVAYPRIDLKPGERPPPGPSPKSVQLLRDMEPMFQDMLKDFKLKLRFECYGAIRTQFGIREASTTPKYVDIMSVTDKDLDKYGTSFFENEEIMLEVIQRAFPGDTIAEHVKEWNKNTTVPVFQNWGAPKRPWTSGSSIFFRPSQHFFKTFFEGKTLDFVNRGESHPRPASFDEIGYKSEK